MVSSEDPVGSVGSVRPRGSSRADQYLTVATRLFAERGYVGTTMDMIIAEVGGSKATLYRHFPTKESLLTGLMDRVAAPMNPGDDGTDLPDVREALMRKGATAIRGATSPQAVAVLRISLAERDRFPKLAQAVWEHGPAITYSNFRTFLLDRRARGQLTFNDAQLTAEHFFGSLLGHLQLKVAFGMTDPPSGEDMDHRVGAAVDMFLARYGV